MWLILNNSNNYIPLKKFDLIMPKSSKQVRVIVHLEKDGNHYYYGNLKALCDNWSKDEIGVSYSYLKNLNIASDKPFINHYCTIRKGIIITSSRKLTS